VRSGRWSPSGSARWPPGRGSTPPPRARSCTRSGPPSSRSSTTWRSSAPT
jgi:hypothetical protein